MAVAAIAGIDQKSEVDSPLENEKAKVQDMLAQPLVGEALENLPDAVTSVIQSSEQRWKHKLSENSEPSMLFVALPKDDRNW